MHNDPAHSDCDRQNADSHLRALLLGHSLTLQVSGGEFLGIVDGKVSVTDATAEDVLLAALSATVGEAKACAGISSRSIVSNSARRRPLNRGGGHGGHRG